MNFNENEWKKWIKIYDYQWKSVKNQWKINEI